MVILIYFLAVASVLRFALPNKSTLSLSRIQPDVLDLLCFLWSIYDLWYLMCSFQGSSPPVISVSFASRSISFSLLPSNVVSSAKWRWDMFLPILIPPLTVALRIIHYPLSFTSKCWIGRWGSLIFLLVRQTRCPPLRSKFCFIFRWSLIFYIW